MVLMQIMMTLSLLLALAPQDAPATKKSSLYLEKALPGPMELLWPEGAPGALGKAPEDKPSLTLFPAKETGPAVVVCPGGGYGNLALGHEGRDVAAWLNKRGYGVFVLRYRLGPRYHHPAMMHDVQRAIRMVRSRAAEWKVDPKKIGVMGFSAGGHLASTAVTHFDDGKADAKDPIDRVNCRPDFGILVYPVIVLGKSYTHKGSQRNLLGDKVGDPKLIKLLSNDRRVTKRTPPCFLIHTGGDRGVPPENSVDFYRAMRKAGVSVELHLYEKGHHGFGLAQKERDKKLSTWPDLLAVWLTQFKRS